jgi:hypothetical protein
MRIARQVVVSPILVLATVKKTSLIHALIGARISGFRMLGGDKFTRYNDFLKEGAFFMKREFRVIYTPIEDGWIMAQVPELPGAVTQGCGMDEAREMIQDAVELLL